jgi:uncharacterized protein involved in outer membrane biogenesis
LQEVVFVLGLKRRISPREELVRGWIRAASAAVILLLVTVAAVALFGPNLLGNYARGWVKAETGRVLTLGKVSINLLALSVEVHDLSLTEVDQTRTFVAWERLYLALSPRSLWHRAPVIRELHLENPTLHIERLPDARFNFSDLLERPERAPDRATEAAEPASYSLNNLTIAGGRIEIIDRTLAEPASHRVEALELALPFIGNLPYLADRYVQPLLRATVNGTPFEFRGELKPFADTREYGAKLKFDGIDLPYYLGYLPANLPVTVNNGRLDVDLDLIYRASASTKPVLEMTGRFDLMVLDLRERSGRPLLFMPLLEARLAPSRPLDRQIHLASLSINNLQSWLDRNPDGEWNFARLSETAAPDQAPTAAQEHAAPLQLQIDQLRLRNGHLGVRDNLPAGGFATTLLAINLDADDVTLAQDQPFRVALDLGSARRERLSLSGQMTIKPLSLDLAIETRGVPLAAYQPYYQAQTTAVIAGELQAGARLQISPQQPLLVSDTRLEVRDLDLPLSRGEGLKLAGIVLQGGRFNLAANQLDIADLALTGADLRFSRNRSGHWSFLDRNYPLLARLAEPTAAAPASTPEQRPLHYRIDRIALDGARIVVRDELPARPANFAITDLDMTIRDLAVPEAVPGTFQLSGTFQQRGEFQVSGSAALTGPVVSAAVQLRHIPLPSFAPYLAEQFRLVLVDGALDARLQANVAQRASGWQGRIGGDLGIRRFRCLDATHREDLLRWEQLQLRGIDAHLEPLSLKIEDLALNDYYARVLLDEQARLNFVEVFRTPPPPAGSGEPAAAGVPAIEQQAQERPQIDIGKITLQGGRVNFTDRHMPRPFSVEMLQLGGRIEGLSATPGTRAEVDLRGRLRNESPLTIAGTLNPLADPLFLDLSLNFNDMELSPLSPYSGTYVGYLIERGKLNVALTYLVENGRLQANNKIFLDQFTFGAAVESDRATSLPVRLAVALLKDRNGEIHLNLPVAGNLDDPQFSVWAVIWQIIKNLLVKAATSPLALLGTLAGGGEEVSIISFPVGSAQLTGAEQAKLAKLADALRERHELKIEVRGYVDPDHDPEGYRREVLQDKLRREKFLELARRKGGELPADVATVEVTADEYPDYLWRVYRQADFPKPRSFIGLVRHLPDAEMEKLLLANLRMGPDELRALAQSRAQAVITALVEDGGVPRERFFLATADIAALPADAKISRSRVEFGVVVK